MNKKFLHVTNISHKKLRNIQQKLLYTLDLFVLNLWLTARTRIKLSECVKLDLKY